ncbi:S1 RNA-binding domain-containing protein [Bacillus swezeyi]|uniref:S1 RNA-binding domain-containing protein n=1 Tax=Bacillus swezeyi TaxID=1925020 RepID=A0A5M8RFC7_9BACI|nr:S1 RNA-binding domain-containing protein [Bacillus swezeyi]KAA6446909.1 S1 RNA-binding domain-containing protein [Bacillus swezeyi]KAA6471477.1 S1 RNA-binding domain-containing protein [Bacillus swezeyi]
MTETFTTSWSEQTQLDNLARIHRNKEIIKGAVRSVGFKEMRIHTENGYEKIRKEIAYIALEGGITAYCPAEEFSERDFKSLNGFTGTIQEVIIDHLELENQIAIVSVKKADEIKKQRFISEIDYLTEKGTLDEVTYEGTVSGYNPKTQRIFVRVKGTDCFMLPQDWDWNRVRNLQDVIERGQKIQVKVLRFDPERDLVQVSRKDTIPDPWDAIENLKEMNTVAGKVSGVSQVHGIFVQLENGLEVKGLKPAKVEEPNVGDVVSCVVRSVDRENRRAKVVIVGYPRGKKKRKDVGDFLFE